MIGWLLVEACINNPEFRMERKKWRGEQWIGYNRESKSWYKWQVYYRGSDVVGEFFPPEYSEFDFSDWVLK